MSCRQGVFKVAHPLALAPRYVYSFSHSTLNFQNTTARMESHGLPNKVQLSQETADLLTQAGKGHWIKPREETIQAKGEYDQIDATAFVVCIYQHSLIPHFFCFCVDLSQLQEREA